MKRCSVDFAGLSFLSARTRVDRASGWGSIDIGVFVDAFVAFSSHR